MREQFDFSKRENQENFEKLEENEKEKIRLATQAEAEWIKERAQSLSHSDKPEKDAYEKAEQELKEKTEQFAYLLSQGYINSATNFRDQFNLPEATVREAAKEGLIKCLSQGAIDDAIEIRDKFNLPETITDSQEVREAAKKELIECLSHGYIGYAIKIINGFNLPETTVREAAKKGLIKFLSQGDIDSAIRIKDKFNLPETITDSQEVQEAAKEGLIKCLSRGHIDSAIRIKDKFNLPETITDSQEVQEATKKGLIERLSQGDINDAINIRDEFNIPILHQEIIKQIPELENLINEISQMASELKIQAEKSSDLVLELCRFIKNPEQLINALKDNPFLIDAITNNPRFASRLLIKFPEFDESSKENIEKLFAVKKKIIEQNPDIEPESWEFRQLMQAELKAFKNNPEIMEAIEKQGVNLNEWLNYSETSYFNLTTGGAEISFSEKIRTPIDRIKETIDSYAYTIKSVLKEYRSEMEKYEIILEDANPIQAQIAKMETALAQARAEGNEKKSQGIERGLASQREKLNNLKKGWLWDKLIGEIAVFQRLKNSCFDAQTRLLEAETKLTTALSGKMPSGKMIQDIKQAMTSSKEELRNKFNDLEKRIEDFKTELPNLISPCLGQERSEGLIQEIEQKVAEQFDHFNSDRTTVANLFSERGDKETSQLESRPMSIFVWARNPDIDLYQGNYSLCCISIETGNGGGSPESTIADYNTDLGIQIVNIWDETKNEPVTAAWCWLGKDDEGKTALVVDNIESNTLYSANFPEQLTEELFEYLKDYAKKIGVDKVVLGKVNNDLPTASKVNEMEKDKPANVYEKIGGYNRNDGYYLEAQMYGTKIIQESEEKIKEKEKEKVKITKVEFKDIKIEPVSDKNLSKILQAERKIYAGTRLISGQAMVEDIRKGNGFEYSIAMQGIRFGKKQAEIVGYIVAVEDETDEGDASIYMEDIAVLSEAQRQGVGWELLKTLVNKLKTKAQKDGQPILFDMNLREESQALLQKHKEDLENLGVKLIEEALVPDYYDEGEDALYQVYQIGI